MDQVYVGYKPGPLAPTLKSDLAVMEHLKFRPVRNANDGCCVELLGQESIMWSWLMGSSADVTSSSTTMFGR
jgi:hypothetical protein